MLIFVLFINLLIINALKRTDLDLDVLTDNFFENLHAMPQLQQDLNLGEESRHFIDKQIENYKRQIKRSNNFLTKQKRSLSIDSMEELTRDTTGVYLLEKIQPIHTIPVNFPNDLVIFQQNSNWFVAALECTETAKTANLFLVFSYKENKFQEIARISVTNALKLSVFSEKNTSFIVVAENTDKQSKIFQFSDGKLEFLQYLNMNFVSNVEIWQFHREIYMSLAQFTSNEEISSLIYKWKGKHFDLIQSIDRKGVKKMTAFEINQNNYLAIANFQNNLNQTRIYSEILKFNYETNKFELFQKIQTNACTDVKFFKMGRENFLIFANLYEKSPKINYETYSILYKFVDDYFVPFQGFLLNGIKEWLPVQGENAFILVSNSIFEGLKVFQYNGWIFVESDVKFPFTTLRKEIKSLRINPYNKTSIVVSNRNDNENNSNIFQLVFKPQNTLKKIQNELMNWCKENEEKLQSLDLNLVEKRSDTIKMTPKSESFHKDALNRLEEDTGSDESDYDYDDIPKNATEEDLIAIESKIAILESTLKEIEENLAKPPKYGNLIAETIILQDSVFDNLQTDNLNRFHIGEILGNTFDINKGFTVDSMLFLDVIVDQVGNFAKINGNPKNSLIKNDSILNLDHLIVKGDVTLNNTKFGKFGDLLVNGHQKIEDFHINRLQTENLKSQYLNSLNLKQIQKIKTLEIANLNVENLTIGGFINKFHVPTLEKYSLKISGNQEIEAPFFFENLKAPNLNINTINNRNLNELIYINEGKYEIEQNIAFKNHLILNRLNIIRLFNNLKVVNNEIQILYNNRTEQQYITGEKIFENVKIKNSIKLSGKIKSKVLERFSPVRTIEDDLLLENNFTFTGNVKIHDFIKINDLLTNSQQFSLKKVKKHALKLTDTKINTKLQFNQQVITNAIVTDQINGFKPEDYVINEEATTQIVKGSKIFFGDLFVKGDTTVAKINNIDLNKLNILFKDSNQNITGKHHVKKITAERVKVGNIQFDGKSLENIVRTDRNQTISGKIVINGDVTIRNLTANHIFVNGLINSKHFIKIVQNTVVSKFRMIKARKIFNDLTVENLTVVGKNFENLLDLDMVKLNVSVIGDNFVENLTFTDSCNGVGKEKFLENEIDENGHLLLSGKENFNKILIKGRIFIKSGKVNGINIKEIQENTVKINETHKFTTVTFDPTIISKQPIIVKGHVENLDLDNIVISNSQLEQQIDSKFLQNVTINGRVTFKGQVNDVNLINLRNFADNPENVIINGNVFFTKGPKIIYINNKSFSNLLENVWLQDEKSTLKGYAEFDQLVFEKDILVGGYVDNVSLKLLSDNYLSKSKNQTISAQLDFQRIIFEKNISVPEIELNTVNNIRLEQFLRTALLDGVDQIFENTAFFENFYAKKLQGEYLVNGLDLENDVLRYDKPNLVTGQKTFTNLSVHLLKLTSKIQNVDILDWFKKSVLKIGTFNVTGAKLFDNVTFTKLQVDLLKGRPFNENTIMLRNVPQNVSGIKEFHNFEPVYFKSIKLKNSLNGIDLSKLINNLAMKNANNSFKSELNFFNNITTKNLTINRLYQNINITELIDNITSLNTINKFMDKYNNLMDMSVKIEKSLKKQAYFLDYYKVIQKINNVDDILQITGEDGIDRLITVTKNTTNTHIHLYKWYENQRNFLLENTKILSEMPFYADKIFNQLYLEFQNYETANIGKLYKIDDLQEMMKFSVNSTKYITTFINPLTDENCILFLQNWYQPQIFCFNGYYYLKQILDCPPGFKATSMNVNGNLYIIIIDKEENDSYLITWKLNNATNLFEMHQIIYETEPNSLSVVQYRNVYYLAVTSGKLENAMYTGMVHIRRFNERLEQFQSFQVLDLSTPIQVQFAHLPTNELILYVITDNPIEPLVLYRYEGISGFRKKISATALMKSRFFVHFTLNLKNNRHFIITKDYDRSQINIIEAIFKGGSSTISQN